jgi:hypothetical protein
VDRLVESIVGGNTASEKIFEQQGRVGLYGYCLRRFRSHESHEGGFGWAVNQPAILVLEDRHVVVRVVDNLLRDGRLIAHRRRTRAVDFF